MFEVVSKIPISGENGPRYQGIAYDGCLFYLTVNNEKQIISYDCSFNKKECIETIRCYSYLCYDPKDECFWALKSDNPVTVFKLNQRLEEIGFIDIPKYFGGLSTGIAYNGCNDSLTLSFAAGLLGLDKYKPARNEVIWENCRERILGMVSVCPYYVCQYLCENKLAFRILSHKSKMLKEFRTQLETLPSSAVFFPGERGSIFCRIMVLVIGPAGESYVCDCLMDCSGMQGHISDCNYMVCQTKTSCEEPCPCEDNISRILESIAQTETSIAHILNAEGEKLQKVIECSDDICEILAVNKSVNETISRVTHLELALIEKLERVLECQEICCECD